jgi:hypothetical protein
MPETQAISQYTSDLAYLRSTAETLFLLSQQCMDLGVAQRLRSIAAEMKCRIERGDIYKATWREGSDVARAEIGAPIL